jgi:hypothetical protein
MSDEWRDDGYAAPSGDWPGGHRYGLVRDRFMQPYVWSDADRALADAHGITLPEGLGWVTVETWWNQPLANVMHVDVDEAPGVAMYSDEYYARTTVSRRVTTARRYQRWEWDYDPLRALRAAVRR